MRLSNPQWETFALHYAGGASKTEAARRAGYRVGQGNQGSRLAKHPEIAQRVQELRTTNEQTGKVTETLSAEELHGSKPYIINTLVTIHALAMEAKQFSTCVNAMALIARINKLIDSTPGPRSVTQINHVNGLTKEKLHEVLTQSLGALPPEERKRIEAAGEEILDAEMVPEPESD